MTDPARPVAAPPPPGWRLCRVGGVVVVVRASVLLTLTALWVVLYLQYAQTTAPWSWWVAPLLTTVTCLAFLASILGHELAHAAVARLLGLEVGSVTLLHLGGFTRLESEPAHPRDEAMIAAAGPLANLLAAGVLLAAGTSMGPWSAVGGLLIFVGQLNGMIGVFNLLPGHPLDGGALVRSATWAATGDAHRGLRLSGLLGRGVGGAMIVGGILGALPGGPGGELGWLWLAGVGAFVTVAAHVGVVRATARSHLAGLRARDLSRRVELDLPGATAVGDAEEALRGGEGVVLVVDSRGAALGSVGTAQLARVPAAARDRATVGQHMLPVVGVVDADTDLFGVLERFARSGESTLAVVDDGRAVATLAAGDVLSHLERP